MNGNTPKTTANAVKDKGQRTCIKMIRVNEPRRMIPLLGKVKLAMEGCVTRHYLKLLLGYKGGGDQSGGVDETPKSERVEAQNGVTARIRCFCQYRGLVWNDPALLTWGVLSDGCFLTRFGV